MFKLKKAVFSAMVILSILSMASAAFAAEGKGGISVTGKGSVKVKPDIATIYIGVTTDDADAGKAQELNSVQMEKVLKAIKDNGIGDKDIQTAYFSIYPKYEYDYSYMAIGGVSDSQISGYTVTNSINVIVRDIDKVGEILDAAIKAGANYGGNVNFSLSDDSKYYAVALDLAIKNAKLKADAIAKSLGVSIGAPVSVTESGYYGAAYYTDYSYDAAVSLEKAARAPISHGELEVSATVNVVYEY